MKRILQRILPAALAIGLLGYALKDISLADITSQFRQADYWWITLAGFATFMMFIVRGMRWRQALLALGYKPTTFRATVAFLAGVIASMIVPGSGELTRCATLQRTDRVPFSQGVGSVVAERIVDLIVLGLLLLLTFLLELTRMQAYLSGLSFTVPGKLGWWLISLALLAGLGGLWLIRWVIRHQIFRHHPFVQKLTSVGIGLWKGFSSIRRLPNPWFFLFLTVLNQVLAGLSIYWLFLALKSTQSLPPTAALTILTVSSLGGILIPTQGGIGTFHFLVSRALVLYGFAAADGAVVATFLHAVSFGISLLLSSLSFLIVPFLVAGRASKQHKSLVE